VLEPWTSIALALAAVATTRITLGTRVGRFDQILAEDFLCSNPDGSLGGRAAGSPSPPTSPAADLIGGEPDERPPPHCRRRSICWRL
jgi:hypothetical protein